MPSSASLSFNPLALFGKAPRAKPEPDRTPAVCASPAAPPRPAEPPSPAAHKLTRPVERRLVEKLAQGVVDGLATPSAPSASLRRITYDFKLCADWARQRPTERATLLGWLGQHIEHRHALSPELCGPTGPLRASLAQLFDTEPAPAPSKARDLLRAEVARLQTEVADARREVAQEQQANAQRQLEWQQEHERTQLRYAQRLRSWQDKVASTERALSEARLCAEGLRRDSLVQAERYALFGGELHTLLSSHFAGEPLQAPSVDSQPNRSPAPAQASASASGPSEAAGSRPHTWMAPGPSAASSAASPWLVLNEQPASRPAPSARPLSWAPAAR